MTGTLVIVGSNGVTAGVPLDSNNNLAVGPRQMAGVNPSGAIVPLLTDSNSNLLVNIAAGSSSGGTVAVSGGTLSIGGGTLSVSNVGTSALSVGGTVSISGTSSITQAPLLASGITAVSGTFTATGNSAPFTPPAGRPFNIAVWATGGTAPASSLNGTVYLARSTDGGTTYLPLTASGTQLEVFTTCASESWSESQVGVTYELVCSAYTSGTINYRMSV